jgi:hypothetical protein
MHDKSLSLLHAGWNQWILDAQLRCLCPWRYSVRHRRESPRLTTNDVNFWQANELQESTRAMTMNDDRYRTLLGAFSAVADQPTVKAVLHSLRGVLASTSKLHGVELYLLSNDGQTLSSFEFDRDEDAPAINVGAKLSRIGGVARVLDEQKPVFIPDLAPEICPVRFSDIRRESRFAASSAYGQVQIRNRTCRASCPRRSWLGSRQVQDAGRTLGGE